MENLLQLTQVNQVMNFLQNKNFLFLTDNTYLQVTSDGFIHIASDRKEIFFKTSKKVEFINYLRSIDKSLFSKELLNDILMYF